MLLKLPLLEGQVQQILSHLDMPSFVLEFTIISIGLIGVFALWPPQKQASLRESIH